MLDGDPAVSWWIYTLVVGFGVGSWLSINSVWVELPLLVPKLPEGWNLPSYLTLIIQVANISPLIIFTLDKIPRTRTVLKSSQPHLISSLLILALISTLLLSWLWEETAVVADERRSLGLFALLFLVSIVNCSSSVTFIPYLASLPSHSYVTAYYVGAGVSGLIPALLSLAQGVRAETICVNETVINQTLVGPINESVNETSYAMRFINREPNFSVSVYFLVISGFMLVSCVSFLTLIYSMRKRRNLESRESATYLRGDSSTSLGGETNMGIERDNIEMYDKENAEVEEEMPASKIRFVYTLILVTIVNGMANTGLYSVQTYSCLPYGPTAYHIAVVLTCVANPVAAFLPTLITTSSMLVITAQTLMALLASAYIFVTAAQSPEPPLVGTVGGTALIIMTWALTIALLIYLETVLASSLRRQGRNGLLWCGAFTQVGSAIGALTMFPLVNVLQVFTARETCDILLYE